MRLDGTGIERRRTRETGKHLSFLFLRRRSPFPLIADQIIFCNRRRYSALIVLPNVINATSSSQESMLSQSNTFNSTVPNGSSSVVEEELTVVVRIAVSSAGRIVRFMQQSVQTICKLFLFSSFPSLSSLLSSLPPPSCLPRHI